MNPCRDFPNPGHADSRVVATVSKAELPYTPESNYRQFCRKQQNVWALKRLYARVRFHFAGDMLSFSVNILEK